MKTPIMKTTSLLKIIAIFLCVALFSCKKDGGIPESDGSPGIPFNNSEMIPATITGFVLNDANAPISGAQVHLGNAIYTTDEYGYFYFINANTPANATLITVTKNGFFDGHRTIIPIKNKDNQVRIKLLTKGVPQFFTAADGASLALEKGVTIEFPKNAIVYKGTTVTYTGKVTLFHKYIDPERSDLEDVIPGSLRGVRTEGADVLLKTFGMEIIEIYDDMGTALQLETGSVATIHMPVRGNLLSDASETIPLWYFNTDNGMWEEEGAATLKNGKYESKIPHFSSWNWDKPVEGIMVDGVVHNQNGVPVAGVKISGTGTVPVFGKFRFSSFTNSQGEYKIKLPANTNVALILDLQNCVGNTYTKSIQTQGADMNAGIQVFSITNATTFECILKDCNNQILQGSALELILGTTNHSLVSDAFGKIKVVFPCFSYTGPVKIFTHNPNTDKYGLLDTTLIPNQLNDLGNVNACGYDYQYLKGSRSYLIGNCWFSNSVDWLTPEYYIEQSYNGQTLFVCKDQQGNDSLRIQFSGSQSVGTHPINYAVVRGDSINNPVGSVNITEYNNVDKYIKGDLQFEYTPSTTYLTKYNLSFYIIRRQ